MQNTKHTEGLTFGFDNPESRGRLKELILYIADQCKDDPKAGATKLNKILYYADFVSFREYGESITGAEYMRLENGPVPVHLLPVRNEMVRNGDIKIERTKHYLYPQVRVVALREPSFASLKARDIALVEKIIEELSSYNATDVSALSHGIAWQIVDDKEHIPYEAALLSDEKLNKNDLEWATGILSQHNLSHA